MSDPTWYSETGADDKFIDASEQTAALAPYAKTVDVVPNTRTVGGHPLSADVVLDASDVHALPDSTSIPSKTSDLTNDAGFLTTAATWGTLSGKPAVIAAGADAGAARSAIGAGTSNLALGTTSGTAKAGDYAPDLSSYATTAALTTGLAGKQAAGSYATAAQGAKADSAVQPAGLATYAKTADVLPATYKPPVADLPAGSTLTVLSAGGGWPARPTSRTDVLIRWVDVAGLGTQPSDAITGDAVEVETA